MSNSLAGTSIIGWNRGMGTDPAGRSARAATGEAMEPEFRAATLPEVDRACQLAAAAFPVYAALPVERRGAFLREIATRIEALGDALVERMMAESALPQARVAGERGRTVNQLRMFADLIEEGSWVDARIETALPDRQPLPKPDMRSMLVPLGPVGVFCAGNFPLAFSVAGGDSASALAAGCPIIVVAHTGHMGTAELVGSAIVEAAKATGMPEGVFSLLFSGDYSVGQALVKHPALRAVGFTGSRRGGTALMDLAAARREPIPVYTEMSSVNPIFLLPQALRERWGTLATGLHGAITGGAGQFCTKPGLIFLPAGKEADQLMEKLRGLIADTTFCPMLNASIADNFATRRAALSAVPTVQTVADGADGQAGLFVTTAKAFRENGVLHEEVFGPASLVVLCEDQRDLLACAEALEGQLTATIHAEAGEMNDAAALGAVLQRKAGRLIWNGYPTGLEVCHATFHGGPFPATSDGRTTSVGTAAITRWTRGLCWQNHPAALLPPELQDGNPRRLWRLVNGQRTC